MILTYYHGVGTRLIHEFGSPVAGQTKVSRTLAMIAGAVGLPVLPAFILVAADIRSDLSELKPADAGAEKAQTIIGWPDLDPQDGHPAQTRWPSQTRVKMLGYMMEGYAAVPDAAQLGMFILTPEAGYFLHPARRIPEEMVEIWLIMPTSFKNRRLVWVSGLLARTTVPPGPNRVFSLRKAQVETALETDVTRWYTQ